MKLRSEDNFVISNSNASKNFTIAASAKAFKILSSSIYERKIEAIVRELSCNAYDSHVQAGCPERPFVIHLPNIWEPEFSVEDFGVGLDDEEINHIYTTYFASTKTDSNDVIGALGLGSKTPFSYTDTFNVRARKDGVERSYNAHIGVNGEPAITLLSEAPTTEPNGVKVSVPVNEKDFHQFQNDARKIFSWFTVKPIVLGSDTFSVDNTKALELEEKGYLVSNGNGYGFARNSITAVMGNVAYTINSVTYNHRDRLDDFEATFLENTALYIKFDIGDLDVAASRETISFDPETTRIFFEKTKEAIALAMKDTQDEIDSSCKDMFQAYKLVVDRFGKWGEECFNYQGAKIKSLLDYDGDALFQSVYDYLGVEAYDKVFTKLRRHTRTISSRHFNGYDVNWLRAYVDADIVVFHNLGKSSRGLSRNIRKMVNDYEVTTAVFYSVYEKLTEDQMDFLRREIKQDIIFVDNQERNEQVRKELAATRKMNGGSTYRSGPRSARVKRDQIRILSGYNKEFEPLHSTNKSESIIDADLVEGRYGILVAVRDEVYGVVDSEGGQKYIDSQISEMQEFIKIYQRLFNLDSVIMVKRGELQRVIRNLPNPVPMDINKVDKEVAYDIALAAETYGSNDNPVISLALRNIYRFSGKTQVELILDQLGEDSSVAALDKRAKEASETYKAGNGSAVSTVCRVFPIPLTQVRFDIEDAEEQVKEALSEIDKKYPIIHKFGSSEEDQELMRRYIRLEEMAREIEENKSEEVVDLAS